MAKELVDLAGVLLHSTDAALLVDFEGTQVWLPKSQVEDNNDGTFTMPEWLAIEKGIV